MEAKLVSPASSTLKWEIRISRFPVLIGRSPHAEIHPLDEGVSDLHCEIEELEGRLMVRDLGSESGTFVNDVPIKMSPLYPDDTLRVSQSNFRVDYELPAELTSCPECGSCDDPDDEVEAIDTFFELIDLWQQQRESYLRVYDHDSSHAEAMFPDPPHPEHLEHLIVEAMRRADVDPAMIYAFEQTGVLVTEFNQHTLADEELLAWQDAIDEYEDRNSVVDRSEYPIGAVTMYGPNRKITTMVVAAVIESQYARPIYKKWVGTDVKTNDRVGREIGEFFQEHKVKTVFTVNENVGCPHEEGLDYPSGEECPFCPSWRGPQNTQE
jgi:hypothetical protein